MLTIVAYTSPCTKDLNHAGNKTVAHRRKSGLLHRSTATAIGRVGIRATDTGLGVGVGLDKLRWVLRRPRGELALEQRLALDQPKQDWVTGVGTLPAGVTTTEV